MVGLTWYFGYRRADRLHRLLDDDHLDGVLVVASVERGAVLQDLEAFVVGVKTGRTILHRDREVASEGATEVGLGRDGAHGGLPSG